MIKIYEGIDRILKLHKIQVSYRPQTTINNLSTRPKVQADRPTSRVLYRISGKKKTRISGGGKGIGSPGEQGAGGVRETEGERVGSVPSRGCFGAPAILPTPLERAGSGIQFYEGVKRERNSKGKNIQSKLNTNPATFFTFISRSSRLQTKFYMRENVNSYSG